MKTVFEYIIIACTQYDILRWNLLTPCVCGRGGSRNELPSN